MTILNPVDSHLQCDPAMPKEGAMALRNDESKNLNFFFSARIFPRGYVCVCVCVFWKKHGRGEPSPGLVLLKHGQRSLCFYCGQRTSRGCLFQKHSYLITFFKCSFHRLSYTMYNKAIYNSTETSPNAACRGHIIWGPQQLDRDLETTEGYY